MRDTADVFISYAHEDRVIAEHLVRRLEAEELSVFWDTSGVHAGQIIGDIISDELQHAKCVVVIWSKHSIESDWVWGEADSARQRRVLVPAMVGDIEPPIEFRRVGAANLTGWKGDENFDGYQRLLVGVSLALRGELGTQGSRLSDGSGQRNSVPKEPKHNETADRKHLQPHFPWKLNGVSRASALVAMLTIGVAFVAFQTGMFRGQGPGPTETPPPQNGPQKPENNPKAPDGEVKKKPEIIGTTGPTKTEDATNEGEKILLIESIDEGVPDPNSDKKILDLIANYLNPDAKAIDVHVGKLYDNVVNYWGEKKSVEQIIGDQKQWVRKWDYRQLDLLPGTIHLQRYGRHPGEVIAIFQYKYVYRNSPIGASRKSEEGIGWVKLQTKETARGLVISSEEGKSIRSISLVDVQKTP